MGNDYAQKGAATGVAFFVRSRKKLGGITEEFKQRILRERNSVNTSKKSHITGNYTTLTNKQND